MKTPGSRRSFLGGLAFLANACSRLLADTHMVFVGTYNDGSTWSKFFRNGYLVETLLKVASDFSVLRYELTIVARKPSVTVYSLFLSAGLEPVTVISNGAPFLIR